MGFGLAGLAGAGAGAAGGAAGLAGAAGGLGSLFSGGLAGPIGLGAMGVGSLMSGIGGMLGLGPSGTTPGMFAQMRSTLPATMRGPMSPQQLRLYKSIFPMVQKNIDSYANGTDPFTRFGSSGSLGDLKSQALSLSNYYRAKAGG